MSVKSANMISINTYALYAEDLVYVSMEYERYFVGNVMEERTVGII